MHSIRKKICSMACVVIIGTCTSAGLYEAYNSYFSSNPQTIITHLQAATSKDATPIATYENATPEVASMPAGKISDKQ